MIIVNIDVYSNAAQTQTTYVIPGPPLYGSGTGAPAPPPTVSTSLSQSMLTDFPDYSCSTVDSFWRRFLERTELYSG